MGTLWSRAAPGAGRGTGRAGNRIQWPVPVPSRFSRGRGTLVTTSVTVSVERTLAPVCHTSKSAANASAPSAGANTTAKARPPASTAPARHITSTTGVPGTYPGSWRTRDANGTGAYSVPSASATSLPSGVLRVCAPTT